MIGPCAEASPTVPPEPAESRARAHSRLLLPAILLLAIPLGLPSTAGADRDRSPGFFEQSLSLPGMPAAITSADVTGDGIDDLVVLVAYRGWDDVSQIEQTTFDDIEGMVEVMTVVSALLDKRELRVYPGRAGAYGFRDPLPVLELDTSVHALATGHPAEPLLAITDRGIAAVRAVEEVTGTRLELVPLLDVETSLMDSDTFFSQLNFLQDLNDDGIVDLLLPTPAGWIVHAGTTVGFSDRASATLIVPPLPVEEEEEGGESDSNDADLEADEEEAEREPKRPRHRLPEVTDASGDGRTDLVLLSTGRDRGPLVYLNLGDLRFAPALELTLPEEGAETQEIVFVGDLEGDGSSEAVSQEEIELPEDAGWRREVAEAKRPHFVYRVYRLDRELGLAAEPHQTFEAVGYTFEGQDEDEDEVEIRLPGGFQDLDGDGRLDLVSITLDFSLFPLIMRVLFTGSLSLRMDFHPWCQQDDGRFREVADLDLSGKFKINLRNVQIKHLSQFAGDFNGDGRADFVQLGRGKKVTIHQGGPDCTYPTRPDRTIRLAREPRHLGLVRILDLDANGRSDLYVVHPEKARRTEASTPVRVDLYLSEAPGTSPGYAD